uniref:Uncharacterized protein n=1 Tax=Photinus pyralis TaxID=7054 RepID=A0A1Y1MSN3_PHOPY
MRFIVLTVVLTFLIFEVVAVSGSKTNQLEAKDGELEYTLTAIRCLQGAISTSTVRQTLGRIYWLIFTFTRCSIPLLMISTDYVAKCITRIEQFDEITFGTSTWRYYDEITAILKQAPLSSGVKICLGLPTTS